MPQQTLRVFANPYAALDHEQRPAGRVLIDPVEHMAPHDDYSNPAEPKHERRYVGAALDPELTKVLKRAPHGSAQADLQDTVWKHEEGDVELPDTPFYRLHLRQRSLFPADQATADLVGMPFVERDKAIAAAKQGALALHFRERPDGPIPEWATPEDLAPAYHLHDSRKASHKVAHAAKLAAAAKASAPPKTPSAPQAALSPEVK